jgi:hypothetical protein
MFIRNCPDCGKELSYKWNCELRVANERNSVCKSCRTIRANKSPNRKNTLSNNPFWKGHEEIPRAWFSKYFLKAGRKKKRTGTITMQDVWELYLKQDKKCALTGIPISFTKDENGYSASIDRIDSKKEYVLENVQLVHKDVNLMKNHFNQEYFIDMCKKVASNFNKG